MTERTPSEESLRTSGVDSSSPDRSALTAQETVTGPSPWILTAKPGLVIEVPFTLAAAAIELRGDDLYVRAGDLLVVVKGYGPALDAGDAPSLVDAAGDWFSAAVPKITAGTPVVLTDSPIDLPPKPIDQNAPSSQTTKLFGGALLAPFELQPHAGLRPVGLGALSSL